MVLVGVVLKDSLVALHFDECINSIQVVVFCKAAIYGLHHQLVGMVH